MIIPHSKPCLGPEELAAITNVFNRGQIAVGPEIELFEAAVAKYIGVKHAVAVCNGTAALHLTLVAMGIGTGDEVILPASVCPGVLHAIEYTGATPVVVDCNAYDLNISVMAARKAITASTKAVIAPHLFGIPSDLDELLKLGVPIVEDCAQSIGASYQDRKVGSYGYVSTFSFYATKMMTSIDGGMVLTNDDELAALLRDLRYYGGKQEYKLRYNCKMQNLHAALGLVQLNKLDAFVEQRSSLAAWYDTYFDLNAAFKVIRAEKHTGKRSSYYRYIVKIEDDSFREEFKGQCFQAGVELGDVVFESLARFSGLEIFLENTELFRKTALSFPMYPTLDCSYVKQFLERYLG